MDATNATTARLFINLNSGFAVIGCLSSLSAVVLILIARAYLQYVHRLQLYLAIVSFVSAMSIGFETLPVTVGADGTVAVPNGSWDDACVAIGYIAQHFGFSKAYCVVWICVYVFVLAMFQKQLKQPRYEVTGLVIVFALPAVFAWVPLLKRTYGLVGIWCWIKVSSDEVTKVFLLGLSKGSEILLHVTSIILLSAVVFKLCRGVFLYQSHLQSPHRAALMEVLPLTIYPSIYSIANLASATKSVFDVATHGKNPKDSNIDEMVVVCLLQTFLLALPLSFLMHPSVRRELARQYRSLVKRRTPLELPVTATTTSDSDRLTQVSDHAANMIQAEGEEEPLLSSRSGYSVIKK